MQNVICFLKLRLSNDEVEKILLQDTTKCIYFSDNLKLKLFI